MSRKPFVYAAIAGGVVAVFAVGYLAGRSRPSSPPGGDTARQERRLGPGDPSSERMRVIARDDDPALGPRDALVTIVEFTDFQDRYGERAAVLIRQLARVYAKDIRVIVKQAPLPFHTLAAGAAEAALAAHEQGKFWEYHDLLFANQAELARGDLETHAARIGLDVPRFRDALDRHTHAARVKEDLAQLGRLGQRATPTFYVNGRLVKGAQPLDTFRRLIDEELAHARRLASERGLAPGAVYEALMRDARPPGAEAAPAAAGAESPPDPSAPVVIDTTGSPAAGPASPPVTLVTFTGFSCLPCATEAPVLARLLERFPGQLRVVWKNLPVSADAAERLAAEAAFAAHAQGKFLAMYQRIFTHQDRLDRATLVEDAKAVGLDLARFGDALDRGTHREQAEADVRAATALRIDGAPVSFLNGRRLAGARSEEEWSSLIRGELAKSSP